MRCASLHRKLGTHISKVKSLSMDSWTNEQVEVITYRLRIQLSATNLLQNMRKSGNEKANELWNSQRKKPPIPLDVDEVDSAMERFIRQKYEKKMFVAGAEHKAAPNQQYVRPESPTSSFGIPPSPPPKPGRKFGLGLRSSSSASFLRRGNHKEGKQKRPANITTPLTLNKKSKIVGATIGLSERREGLQMKLIHLAEMGFIDMPRNGRFNWENEGDLERTVKSLEKSGYKYSSGEQLQARKISVATLPETPVSSRSFGASVRRSSENQEIKPPSRTPRTSRLNNPFDNQNQSPTSVFDEAMANMTISTSPTHQQSEAPFIPAAYPPTSSQIQDTSINSQNNQQSHNSFAAGSYPLQTKQVSFHESMTPSISQSRQFINNPYVQHMNNPFMASPPMSPTQSATSSYISTALPNPFLQQPIQNQIFSPQPSTLSPQQTTFSPQQQQYLQSPQTGQRRMSEFNPYLQQEYTNPYHTPQSPATYYNLYQQQMTPQVSGRLDKNSIMALYNHPELAPSAQSLLPPQDTPDSSDGSLLQEAIPSNMAPPRRSVTMPLVGSNNPFLSAGNPGS